MNNSTTNTISATLEQFSYKQVRSTFIFMIAAGILLYVGLVVMSTATITHSKTLVEQIRDRQGEITELNGALSIKNHDLALELQNSNVYVDPVDISYIEKDSVVSPSFALEH